MELAFLFILALVAGSQAGPIQDRTDQCAQQCTVSRQFNYEEGKVYNYLYENSIRTQIQGASEDHAGLELKANVALKFASKCEAVMQLSDVRLSEHDPITSTLKTVSSDLGDRLAKYPIRVSFQDGKIEHVCLTDSSETPEIVNIKKGILSVIQNSMDDISKPQTVPETDVAGDCEAEYTSADKGWYNVKVTKSKNLLGCTGRHSALSSIQGIPYGSQSKVQSLPLVKSTYDCEQELVKSNGRLVSAMCEETHVFAPFSRHESGAVTNSRQTLTFRNEGKTRVDLAPVHMRVPLKFDHDDSNAMSTSVVELQQKLQEVCEGTKNGITRETPGLFKSIVYIMKTMDSPAMVDIFQKVKKPEFCPNNSERVKKFFMDAIPMTGTPAGVKLLTQMIIGKEVSGIEADMWLTSLSFIQNPTVDMLAEVKPLLSMNTHVEKAMLSVSSLVNSLCKTNPSCDNYLDVKKIISLLESKIENGCIVKESEMKTTLIALRAIGNAGFGTTAIPTIVKCFSRSENPIEIRLSAIESFRRMPCKVDRSPLLAILNNQEEDSEVRIAAYKSLMACPSDAILSHVKTVLSKEEVNQVGSYIWSHLTNLMESADPHKQAIRAILDDSILKKEFDMDKRKYSRNYEGSLFLEKINTGATVDADMIWSSKSFIPRSGMLNLTLDLFGSAVNLFEVGGRVEGLEYFLESYLGPNGYFSENDAQNAADETAVTAVRADKVNRITGRMSKVMDELRGNLYLRVFGNELRYMNFKGIDSLMSSEAMSVFDLLMKMSKDNKYQFSHSTMFMDSRFTIPTSSGFPLSLSVNGTATIDLQASGKLDVLKLASNPASLDINGIIKPSGAIQIASLMTINAASSKIGVKMISTLHTSTSLEGKVTLAEGSILDAEIGLPEKQMDIFSMESSFFTIHRELEREQEMITSNRQAQKVCTGDSLAKVAGIELCGELQYPNASLVADAPYFPITGPVKLGLVLNKKDTLTGYRLRARSTHTNEENIIHLSFSTPNSNIDRSFGIDFNLNKKAGTVDSSITSPWTSGNFKGVLNNDNNLKGVTGALNWDGKLRYEVKAMVSSEKSGPGMLYTPSLSIKIPGQKPVELKGTVKYAAWKILDIDMEFAGMTSSPVLVKTSVQNKGQMMRASASIQLEPKKEYIFDTSMQTIELKKKVSYRPQISLRTPKDEIFAFGGSFDQIIGRGYQYKFVLDKVASQPLVLKGTVVQREFRRGRVLFNVKVDLRTPLVETQMRTKLDNRNFKTIASDIDLKYVIKKYARDNVKLVTKISNLSSKSLTKLKGAALLTSKKYPEACFKFSGNLNHNNKHSDVDVDLTYGSDPKDLSKQMTVKASVDRQINKNWSQATLGLMGEYTFGNDLRLFSKVKHSHDDKSIESSVVFRKNKDAITADLVVKDESKELKKMSAKLDLYLTGKSISLSHSIEETKYQDFTSTLLTQFGKSKSSVITAWKYSNDGTATLRSDVNIDGFEPLVVETDYKVSPGDYKATGSIQKGKNRYSLAASSLMNLDLVQVNVDILCPSRHIITHTEGSLSGGKYNIRADTRWNADRDDTQRVTVRGSGHISGFEQIDGSFTIQYPSRTIALNLKQSTVGKYISHVDFQWEPKKQMSIDTAFGSYDKGGKRELQGSVTMQTPFESLSKLDVKVNHVIDQSQYKTNVDVEWNPKQIMSATVTLKKPIDLTSIDFEIVGKTPFSEMKNFKVSHTQKKKDAFNSATKVEWNKQSVQMDTTLANNGNARKTELLAEVDIKTSFRTLKTISLHASYLLNEKRMQSRATLKANKNDYIIETLVNHEGFDLNKNSGEITITIPSNNIKASWNHNLNDKDVTTSSEITWDNDRKISINFNGLKDLSSLKTLLTSAIQIQTPFANFKDITFQVKHQSRSGFVDSIMSLVNEGTTIAAAEGKYIRQNGNVNSYFTITNPFRDGDISIKVNSNLEMPLSLDIDISVTPLYSVSLKSSVNRNENGNVYSTIVLQSPQIEPVTITMTREVNRDGISLVLSLAYSGGKVIKINSIYNLGDTKFIKMSFASPFTSVYTSEVSMTTTPAAISVQGNIEALPYIPKWSAEAGLDRSNGISGNIRINTPISAAPYSQFSFSSGSDLRRNQINVNAEYLPGKVINVLVRYNIIDLQSVSFLSTLSTPLSSLQFSSLAINHQGPITDMRTTANIEYSKGQNIILEHTFSTRTGFKGSLGIKTPFSRDLKTSFDFLKQDKELRAVAEVVFGKRLFAQLVHSGSSDQFTSDLTFEMDNDKWNGNLAFEALPVLKTTLSLQTPLKKLGSITAMHSLEGNLMKFNNKLDLTSSEYGLFSVHADFDATDKISGSASIATPIRGYKKISGLFMHDGTFDRFQTRAEASLGTSKIAGDIKLVTKPSVNLDIEVETPIAEYKLLSLSLKHMGDSKSFKTNLKAQKNKLSSEILFNYNNEKKIDMDLTIRHLNYDPVKATFDLSGSWKRFSKKMQVSVGKEKYISDVRFQVKPFSTYVDVRSPLKWLKRHRLTMKHTGSINSFKCNLNYNCNGKKYNGDVSFSNANTIKGDFSFDGPSIPKITARVGHEGSLTKFTSEIEMSYGKRKMAINGDLNFEGGLRGRFDASTPFANMEMIRSSLSHTGSLANFKTEGVFSVNKQEGRLSLALATDNGINANVELFTPFRGLDRLFATFTHSGDFRHFNTESTVGMNEKSISGKVNFDNSATVTGDVSLTSSISDIGSYEGSFRHEGDSNKFISHAEVSVNSKRADLDINFDSTIGYTGFVSFKSPVGGLGQIDGSFRHNGNSKKFNTHAEMNFNGQRNEFDTMFDGTDGFEGFASLKSPITRNPEIGFKYASDPNSVKTNMYAGIDGGKQYNFVVDGSKAPEMKLVISIKTPIRGFEYSELSMNQRGNRNNFHTASILNFQGKTHEVELSLRNTPDIEGKLQIRSPAFKNFETSLAAVGSLNNFQSSFETRVDSRSIIRTDLMLNTDKNFETELKIMSPYFKNLMVSASNMRTSYGINAQALISLGSDRASGNLVLTLKPLISGSLDISTPFTKDVSIQVNHEGQLTNFKSDLDISYGGASQLNIQSSLIAERNINGNFKLESTIPGLKNIGADITHTQDASGINSYVEIRCNGDKTSSKVMYKPDEASIDLKSPFTKDITLKYGLKGSFPKVSATAEASIGSSSIIQIDAKMRTLTDGEISIRTPLKGYEQTGIKLRHMQSEKAFETHGEILVFGQTHTVDLAVSYTSAELKLQTTYMEPITITTRRSGTLTNFETHGEYVYGKSKYEVSLDLNVDTSKEGKLTMSLPQNDAEFSFNILGNRNQFTGVAKIDLNGRFHSIDVTYDSVEKLVISASIKSPLVPSVDASISLNGDITDFTSKAELAVDNDRHNIEASLRSKDNIEAMFTLSSPLTAPLRMELQYNGELLKFESFASFSIDSAVYRSDISLDLKSNIKAQVSVISPKSAPLKVSLSSSKMDAVVSVNYGKSVFYTLNAGLQHDPLSGAVSFDSSLPGYEHIAARFSHEEKNLDFNTHAEVEYGQDKSEADFHFNVGSKLEGSISLRSPYMRTVSSGFNFNGNADRFASHIEASYGSDKYALDASIDTTSKLEGAIIVSTPIQGYKNVEAKMSSAGALPNFDSTLSIKTGRRTLFTTGAKLSTDNGVSAKWIMSSVLTPTLQLDAEYKGVLTDFVSKLGLKYNGESANSNVIFKGLPEPAFTLNLETSLSDPISTTMSLKRQSKAITVHAEGVIGSKTYETDLSVFYGNGITSSLSLKSPVQGLENIKVSAKYSAENQAIKNSISIERNMAEFFYFGGEASWSERIFGNMKLRTPFSGIEQLSAGGSVEGKIPNVKVDVRFANGKNEFSTVAELNHLTSTNGLIIISTPFAGYERLGGSFTKKGDLSDIDFQANVNYATGKDISVQLKNKIDRSSIETEAILQSPYTEDASFRLSFKGNPNAFTNTLSLGMGNENSLSSVTSFELTRSTMSFDSRLSSVLTGYRDEQRAKLLFKGDLLNYEASGSARLFGMDFSADSSLVVSPAFKGQINIRSPFAPLKDVGLSAELIKDGSKYTSSAEIKIDTGKKVKASAEVLKYGWRRLQSAMELNTPFSGWEQFKASYRHTASVDSFECDADLTLFEDSYKGKIMGSLSPLSVSASASTPFKGFEQMNLDASADYSSNALKSDLTIDVASDNIVTMKTDIDFSKNLKSAILSLTTPLEGLKQTSIRYSMSGDIKNFQSELFASIPFCAPIEASTQLKYNSPSDVSGSISFKSQISGLEELKMSAKNIYSGSTYNSHMEASWSSSKKITIQSVLKDSQRDMSGDITLTTPFDIVKQLNIQSATSVSRKEYTSTFSTSYNGFRYADLGVKVATGNNKQVSITMRSPVTMLIEMSGAKAGDLYEGGLLFSRDITQRSDSFIVDGKVNLVKKEIVLKHKCPMMTFNLDGTFTLPSSKVDFVLNNDRYAYDMQLAANNGHIKLVLPSRSLKISGSKSSNKAEASLMWDADRDETKKVAVRAVITPTSDSLKADVALMLPSIGKDAQIESEVILNRGRILFDGKTELSYSKDSRKRITLMTRLEDISTDRSSQNYSFVLGISHPFTSVDVKLSSHVGRSNDRLTGSVNMDYMTARRETKTFSVNGEVDKVKKSAFFNMITPVKRISIVGNTQKQPFQLSFKNSYDNKAPLTTLLSVDTVRRSVNFEMNYDLANPSSELRISAKYVNSSAVAAEIFHIVSGQKISDALITTRLNNSHLLHSRLHWRPSALQELKEYLSHKASSSMTRGSAALDGINADISKEVSQKTAMISQEIINEMMPLMKISADMYERNDYHYRDVVDAVILAIEAVRIRCEKAHTQALDMIDPLKENLLAAVAMVPDVSIDHYMPDLTYISSFNGRMYNMTRHPSVMSMGNKYSQYVRYMNEIRQNPSFNMADRFTSAIYGARNLVNPVILQQGENAFKYWEVKENSQAVLEAVLDWLKEEIEKELSDIQANIMNLAKTSVTVYDPEHGEIQTEVHLPFPVQALDVVPNFDLTPFVSKVRQYTPRVPRITMPSTDITSWLPPFDAEATLEGNTITTFDGVTYELPDSCTQILARDFVDGNFSIILNKVDNNNKSIIISFDGKVVEILPSGQVKINGKNIESSTELNNIVITLFDDEVSVDGAGSFEVTYSPALDTYTININGWYYGKTAGLLGTYDNEPSNDFLSSFGKPIDSIDRFTKTWDIGTSKCR